MLRPTKSTRVLFSETIETNILISENNSRHLGVSIANHLRIFVFETQTKSISIDFINQFIASNGMVIVPAGHILAISKDNQSKYLCIEINNSMLKSEDLRLLMAVKYLKQKQLNERDNDIIQFRLLVKFIGIDLNEHSFFQFLRNSIISRIQFQFGRKIDVDSKYKIIAEEFLSLVNDPIIYTVNHTCVAPYIERLHCSEKALLRCCLSVFNITPQELLKHHLFINALYWISDFEKPVFNIAERLGYSSQSAFSKFIKSQTSQSLSHIRKQIKDQLNDYK